LIRRAWIACGVLLVGLPAASEEPSLPEAVGEAVSTPPGRTIEVEGGGFGTDGDDRRVRELLRLPTAGWFKMRLYLPIDRPLVGGELFLELTTFETGQGLFRGRFRDGSKVTLMVRRDRLPFDFQARTSAPPPPADASALDHLELSHEQLRATWERPLGPLGGVMDATFAFDRMAGTRPTLVAGLVSSSPIDPVFASPGYWGIEDWWIDLRAGYAITPKGLVRLRLDAGYRYDAIDEQLFVPDQAGGAMSLREKERRNTIEVGVYAASAKPGTVIVGGMYRMRFVHGDPQNQRMLVSTGGANGTVVTEGAEVSTTQHRAVFGLAWVPGPKLRANVRLEASSTAISGDLVERRELATFLIERAHSSFEPLAANGQVEVRYAPWRWLGVEGEGRVGFLRGDDLWAQTFLLADRVTPAGERSRLVDRSRLIGKVELRGVLTVVPKTRITVGGRADVYRQNEDVDALVDSFRLGDLSRDRGTVFVAFRTRLERHLRLDGSGGYFFERTSVAGARPTHEGFDARLRASGVLGPATFFLLGVVTDDRYALSPLPAGGVPTGFAPIAFDGRSWIGVGGLTLAVARKGTLTAVYSHVANTADLATQLQNLALNATWALPWHLHLAATGRYLRFHDSNAPWENGSALLGFGTVGGTF
jgi:hypothetical protein